MASSESNIKSETSGKPPNSIKNKRTMRPRDFNRMRDMNDRKSQESGSWADQAIVDDKYQLAKSKQDSKNKSLKFKNNKLSSGIPLQNTATPVTIKSNVTDYRRSRWEPTDDSRLSTTETPPKDEPLCDGVFKGSKLITQLNCHNLDLSQFPIICRETYNSMMKSDKQISRFLPFPMFQHYCTTILNATLLDFHRNVNNHPSLRNHLSAMNIIRGENLLIPITIADYIRNLNNSLTPSGENVIWNLPDIAIPKGPIDLDDQTNVPSGTFGKPTFTNHNVYECYVSPYITMMYILATVDGQGSDSADWRPFPDEWVDDLVANENLLGYGKIEKFHRDGIAKMSNLTFDNDDTIRGLLSYCVDLMNICDNYFRSTSSNIRYVTCNQTRKDNSSLFIIKCYDKGDLSSIVRLTNEYTTIFSPFSFGTENGNKAHFYGFKRRRTSNAPGLCFTKSNGEVPFNWIQHINANYFLQGEFSPLPGYLSRGELRDRNHEEVGVIGNICSDLHTWLDSILTIKSASK